MWTYLRIAGGAMFLLALFLRPLRWQGLNDSAFQLAAQRNDFEAIATFIAAMAFGVVATISTFFTRRVVEWIEMTLTILGILGAVGFVLRYGSVDRGLCLTWPGLMIVGGFLMVALGAHGRYRNVGRE